MAFAILRIQKVKERGRHGLAAVAAHIARTRETSNADPERGIEVLHGLDPEADVMRLLPERRRKDATVAVELLLTASPEFFRPENPGAAGNWDEQRMRKWADLNLAWLRDRYGENFTYAALHLDESTPHIQALIVPLSSFGRLSARDLFGPAQLRQLQTEYARAMGAFGLTRGIFGSKARHESIKKFYSRVNQDMSLGSILPAEPADPKIAVPEPAARDRLSPQRYAERAAREAYRQGWRAGAEKALSSVRPALAKARQFDATRKRLAEREARLSEIHAQTERLREIPLRAILLAAHCTPDARDPQYNWRTPAGRISLSHENHMQWYNHDQRHGGGGAIDLTIHLTGLGFRGAVAWLARHFDGKDAISSARAFAARRIEKAAERAIGLVLPELPKADPRGIDAVRTFLIEQRHLPARLIDKAIGSGAIYAIRYGKYVNAAFRLNHIKGSLIESVGVEIQGIGEQPFHGLRGNDGVFLFGEDPMLELAFCDDAIDALSYLALHARTGLWVAALLGDGADAANFSRRHADQGIKIIGAFSASGSQGRKTRKLFAAAPDATRDVPEEATSWNDLLRLSATANCLFPAHGAEPGLTASNDPQLLRVGDRWVWLDEPDRRAITDHDIFFTVEDPQPAAIRYALALARERWGAITARGSDEFRELAKKEAAGLGIELIGDDSVQEPGWASSILRGLESVMKFQAPSVNRKIGEEISDHAAAGASAHPHQFQSPTSVKRES
jgi:hypothetical protein